MYFTECDTYDCCSDTSDSPFLELDKNVCFVPTQNYAQFEHAPKLFQALALATDTMYDVYMVMQHVVSYEPFENSCSYISHI